MGKKEKARSMLAFLHNFRYWKLLQTPLVLEKNYLVRSKIISKYLAYPAVAGAKI